jgi:hypothetical protein
MHLCSGSCAIECKLANAQFHCTQLKVARIQCSFVIKRN